MMESIFVMVIFLFMVGFGFVFYFSISKTAAADKKIELDEQRSIEAALYVSQLAELQCSESGIENGACIDRFKAMALRDLITNGGDEVKLHYYDVFGFAQIRLVQVYPVMVREPNEETGLDEFSDEESAGGVLIYANPPKDSVRKTKTARTVFFPVTISDVTNGEKFTRFGQLEVKVWT